MYKTQQNLAVWTKFMFRTQIYKCMIFAQISEKTVEVPWLLIVAVRVADFFKKKYSQSQGPSLTPAINGNNTYIDDR